MFYQLDQHYWLKTPMGEARAIGLLDYGQEEDLVWVCVQNEDPTKGQCRSWHNSEVLFCDNHTFLRGEAR